MARIKTVVAALLAALVALFVLQNIDLVEIRIFVWSLEIRRAFLVLGVLGIGILIGWLTKMPWPTDKR